MPNPRWTHDRKLVKEQLGVIGVDEAGRGCLAGPVVAGCVILPKGFFSCAKNRKTVEEINDSKQFAEVRRESLFDTIQRLVGQGQIYAAFGSASVEEIEEYNIVGATCLAMRRAMQKASAQSMGLWSPLPQDAEDLFSVEREQSPSWQVLVDGREMKRLPFKHEGLVKGDTLSLAVSMASLIAKVTRDRLMHDLHLQFPQYDFSSNKGYGAPNHLKALRELGSTIHHRPRFLRSILDKKDQTETAPNGQSQLSFR